MTEHAPGTEPGLQIFSRDWFDAVATKVEEPFRDAVLLICGAYQLGNSGDPNLVYTIILDSLQKRLGEVHLVKDPDTLRETNFVVTEVGVDGIGPYFHSADQEIRWGGNDVIRVLASGGRR